MPWFKKSNPESRLRRQEQHKRVKKTKKSKAATSPDMTRTLSAIQTDRIEIVDPEDFFQDPVHVRNYRDEATFLSIMSEWEIVDHPARINNGNYFSADFEDEFIQMKTNKGQEQSTCDIVVDDDALLNDDSIASGDNSNDESMDEQLRHDLAQSPRKRRFCDFFLGDAIQTGIALPKRQRFGKAKNTRRKQRSPPLMLNIAEDPSGKTLSNTCENHVLKNCTIDRTQLKTEALACSIMGAIGKCPDRDGTPRSSVIDLIKQTGDSCHPTCLSTCDHYDIKEFFRLDDSGNILLNIQHISESQGFGFAVAQNKRLYRKYLKECNTAEENYCRRRSCCKVIKQLLHLMWNYLAVGHPRNKINPYGSAAGPGDAVRSYTLQLAQDHCSTFARNIENFISCTKESREAAPQVVMRNMRQFMNGMKNYLVKHGEGKFQQEVETARSRLKSDEFLNLDAILETVMHQLVVLPLREHLYGMFVDYYTRSEDIQLLAQNVKYACGRSASDFGIRPTVTPPTPNSLQIISNLLLRLQEAELPLDKLDLFLCVISTIFDATGCPRGQQLGADDFLPILVYVVAKCGFVGAEIEAEFMWGLLQPTLLNGEPGYYLTALCSAVHVLKSFMASESENGTGSLDWRASSLPACSSVLRVIIPDECNGSLQTRTLPVRPHTTTREVCRIIAHKARITNPQDYALFKLVDGEETPLTETECPQDIRLAAKGKHCMLAYKRIDAKIAWPTSTHPIFN